jgi:SnoaL-like domain
MRRGHRYFSAALRAQGSSRFAAVAWKARAGQRPAIRVKRLAPGAGGASIGVQLTREDGHMAEAKQVVERHVEAFDAHQADAEPWADDAEFVAPGASMRGREEVLAFLAAFWEAFPDGRLELSRVFGRAPSPQLRGGSLARTAASSARPLPRCRPPLGSSTSAGCPLTRPAATSSLRSICTSIKWSSSPSSASCRSCQRPSTARPNRVPTEGRHVPAFPATSTVRSGAPPVATRSRQ